MIQEPVQPTLTPNPPPRARRTSAIRTGLVVAACLLVAVPVVMAMAANSSSANQPLAAGASAGALTAPDAKGGHGHGGGPGKGHITITAIDGSRISLATEDGWTRTITLGTDAAVMRSDVKIAASALKVGDEVRIRQVRNADGSFTVVELRVVLPHLSGTVTAIGDASLTVKLHDASTRVITLTTDTSYRVGKKPGTKVDVTKGADVDVEGTHGAGDAFTATAVHVRLPHLGGVVTGVAGSTITIMAGGRDGGVKAIIHVATDTAYQVPGATGAVAGGLKDVAVGTRIKAEGKLRADGSLDAASVDVHGPKAPTAP